MSITELVAAVIGTRSSTDWLDRLDDDACVARVLLPAEALEDEHIQTRAMMAGPEVPAPRLGADTDDVLAEAGIAPTLVERLTRSGVVTGLQTPARAARAQRLGSMLARFTERGSAPAA